MSRLMSVTLTEESVWDRTKTVTRRLGWRHLRVGDRLTLCRKVMGRKPDEPLVRIAEVEVTAIWTERLDEITKEECVREGFPDHTPDGFVSMFCDHMHCLPSQMVRRIEWKYIDWIRCKCGCAFSEIVKKDGGPAESQCPKCHAGGPF